MTTDIQGRIERYLEHYEAGDADSGHHKRIKQSQRELQKKQRTYRHKKCDKDDDHDEWDGLGPAQQVQQMPIPTWQMDRSHGYRRRLNPMSVQAPTPDEARALGALGALMLLARYAWLLAF